MARMVGTSQNRRRMAYLSKSRDHTIPARSTHRGEPTNVVAVGYLLPRGGSWTRKSSARATPEACARVAPARPPPSPPDSAHSAEVVEPSDPPMTPWAEKSDSDGAGR